MLIDAHFQVSLPSLFRQDCADGRKGSRVQPQLFHGRTECQGVEGGRSHFASTSDAAYLDVRQIVDLQPADCILRSSRDK